MDDIFSVLGKASYYTTIDLTDAFWSIRVREEDIPKTVFITKYGLNDSGVTGGANTGTHTTNKTQLLEIVRLPVAARKELRTVY